MHKDDVINVEQFWMAYTIQILLMIAKIKIKMTEVEKMKKGLIIKVIMFLEKDKLIAVSQ